MEAWFGLRNNIAARSATSKNPIGGLPTLDEAGGLLEGIHGSIRRAEH